MRARAKVSWIQGVIRKKRSKIRQFNTKSTARDTFRKKYRGSSEESFSTLVQRYLSVRNLKRLVLYLQRKHTHQIARIAVTSFKLHESRPNLLQRIKNQFLHSNKLIERHLKDKNKLKNATAYCLNSS